MNTEKVQRFQKAAASKRKRIRTRAAMMDAAVSVIASRGIEATTVSDIIATSGVSQGTFYYHFGTKDNIVDTVSRAVAAALVDQTDAELAFLERGIDRLALGTTIFATLAAQDHEWGALVRRALMEVGPLQDGVSRGIRKDATRAAQEGGLSGPVSGLAFQSALAVVATGIRSSVQSPEQIHEIKIETSQLVLRLLGADRQDAARLPAKVWQSYIDHNGAELVLQLPSSIGIAEDEGADVPEDEKG